MAEGIENPLAISMIDPDMLRVIEEADLSEWTMDQFLAAGEEAGKVKYFSQWILGKLADAYSKKWGDCSKFAREIHIEPKSLLAYRRVYKKIVKADPKFVPDGYLSWGALQMIAEQPDPVKLIEELTDNGKVTMAETYRHIKQKETGKQVPKKPKVNLKYNEETNMWRLNMTPDDFDKIDWPRELWEYLKKRWEE
jgi:hypothetical protein